MDLMGKYLIRYSGYMAITTENQVQDFLKTLMDRPDDASVRETYAGAPGCMCGCRGDYTAGLDYKIAWRMLRALESGEARYVSVLEESVYVSTSDRAYCIYLLKPIGTSPDGLVHDPV